MTIHIGTSGWAYREWQGWFYPPGLKPEAWLPHYASEFETVEINGTAYRLPDPAAVERWRESVPAGFRMAVKLPHLITHYHRLRGIGTLVRATVAALARLGDRRGPLLAQLPPGLAPDHGLLRAFLDETRAAMAERAWPLVVEFRHPAWISERTQRELLAGGATWCLSDMPICPVDRPMDEARCLYLRRHGPGGRYRGGYPEEALQRDADLLRTWAERGGGEAFAFFNNTADGAALHDARRLRELAGCAQPDGAHP